MLLRLLAEAGHEVHVVPTRAALEFVGAPTWESLAGHRVHTDVFAGAPETEHVHLGRSVDLAIVAPATADLLARVSGGHADDLLTATLLTVTCPVLLAPAMHTEMWLNAATQHNVATLRERGLHVLDPAVGRLAGADSGPGRLPEPAEIAAAALALVGQSGAAAEATAVGAATARAPSTADLAGVRAVVSAGGTREPLDPVRYLGNRSSGRQGLAIADELRERGAEVTIVAAHTEVALGTHHVVEVGSALELASAMNREAERAEIVVMAAAVADFRPAARAAEKIKKTEPRGANVLTLELVENPDVLTGLVARRAAGEAPDDQVIVGFAAETGQPDADVLTLGRAKARRKGADLLAVNAVGDATGFGDVNNAVVILDAHGEELARAEGSKREVAHALVDAVVRYRATHRSR